MDLIENSSGEVQVRSPWESARALLIGDLVEEALATVPPGPVRVLDIGSGDAYLARALVAGSRRVLTVDCVDTGYTPEIVASLDAVAPDGIRHLTEPSGLYDVALACDVAEHVVDDRAFMADVFERVAPGGRLVVTVPAHQRVFGPHDVALGHHRRYSRSDLVALVEGAGACIVASGEFFTSLYLVRRAQTSLRALGVGRETSTPGAEGELLHWTRPAWTARVLSAVLRVEGRLERRLHRTRRGPPGLSCWVVAEVPRRSDDSR